MLVRELALNMIRLGSFAQELSLRMGSFAWELLIVVFAWGIMLLESFSRGIFRIGTAFFRLNGGLVTAVSELPRKAFHQSIYSGEVA